MFNLMIHTPCLENVNNFWTTNYTLSVYLDPANYVDNGSSTHLGQGQSGWKGWERVQKNIITRIQEMKQGWPSLKVEPIQAKGLFIRKGSQLQGGMASNLSRVQHVGKEGAAVERMSPWKRLCVDLGERCYVPICILENSVLANVVE